jgi:hypothetical protein
MDMRKFLITAGASGIEMKGSHDGGGSMIEWA